MKGAIVIGVLVGVFGAACGDGSDGGPGPMDGGGDTAVADTGTSDMAMDTGVDLPQDAGQDAAADTGTADSAADSGVTAELRGFGEACESPDECEDGVCGQLEAGGETRCTRPCSLDVAFDCRDLGVLCVRASRSYQCGAAEVVTGPDPDDDAVLETGDCITTSLVPIDDADLFLLRFTSTASHTVSVTPSASVDVAVDFFNGIGQLIGRLNERGPGGIERVNIADATDGGFVYALVKNVGSASSTVEICLQLTGE